MRSDRRAPERSRDRPRVLWLIKGLGLGGAERLLATMAAKIHRDRFDVEVAYLLADSEAFTPDFDALGIPMVCLDAHWNVESSWPRRLRQLLRDRDYDLVHTHSPLAASVARLLAPRATVFVHTEHNLWSSYRRPTAAVNALTFGRNRHVFAVSDAVLASMRRPAWLGGSRLPPRETLLHGVDLDRIPRGREARKTARSTLGIDESAPVIGTVASLTPQKDHAGLITAFRSVVDHRPDTQLLLVGSGPLEQAIRSQVEGYGLSGNVVFVGPRSDAVDLLPALDVFVLASRFEGLPISLLEAMAAEVACIATAVGGTPEAIVDGRDGVLVPPGEPAQLASAINAALDDPARRRQLAAAAHARVARSFSIDRAVRRTEVVYGELLTIGP